MKKFMWLLVGLVILSGCASPNSRTKNPHAENALVWGATAAGATAGYRYAGPVGGVVGGVFTMLGMKAVLWEPPAEPEARYVVVSGDGQTRGGGSQSYVVNWKRPGGQKAAKKDPRLTVENYQTVDENGLGAVPEDCRTGNWGMDSSCLRKWSAKLDTYQARCVKESRIHDSDCLKRPGILAGEYSILADKLEKYEKGARAGVTYDRLTGLSR
ncbi:MAG: hypothetical protein M0P64_03325 [Candidatus Pacebacteria bacterium]|jgi:hypothetical protein|nr:hypothetical protein [Candidatus Paceibacterota bacterium]